MLVADATRRRGAIARIAGQLDIHPEALRGWVRWAEAASSAIALTVGAARQDRPMPPVDEVSDRQRILELEAKNRELRTSKSHTAPGRDFFRSGARPPTSLKVRFVEEHRDEHGVEPIIEALAGTGAEIAPSTYYAARARPPSARSIADQETLAQITRGPRGELRRLRGPQDVAGPDPPDYPVARCTVERVMRANGIRRDHQGQEPTHHDRRTGRRPPR